MFKVVNLKPHHIYFQYQLMSCVHLRIVQQVCGVTVGTQHTVGPQGRKIGRFLVCHGEPVSNHLLNGLVEHQVPLHWVLRIEERLEEEPFL